ncbi:conserved protein of unknown function [Pseudomonas sp. JV551A1]|nr:conserved protein of unknown function [Pseudomonas sp. JV551A1]
MSIGQAWCLRQMAVAAPSMDETTLSGYAGLLEQELLERLGIDHSGNAKMTQDDRYYMVFVVVAVLLLDVVATLVFLQAIA